MLIGVRLTSGLGVVALWPWTMSTTRSIEPGGTNALQRTPRRRITRCRNSSQTRRGCPTSIRFDLPRLGDINGQRGIHLQCHIGTDTISLHRLGAAMTGLDFSQESIATARRIATDAGADVDFVESDVYSAPAAVGDGFDFVYTGIGALCWLPDIRRWARDRGGSIASGRQAVSARSPPDVVGCR